MPDFQFFDFLVIGDIVTEFIIDLRNISHHNLDGGPVLYAAGGARCWSNRVAVVSHSSEKHRSSLEKIQNKYNIDLQGIHFQDGMDEDRQFLGYISENEFVNENPVAFYSSRKLIFPKELAGYKKNETENMNHGQLKYYPENFPQHYRDIPAAIICPASISTQIQLSSVLLFSATKKLVILSNPQYMNIAHFDMMPVLLKDLTAFITTTTQIKNLFRNRTTDLWEMAEHLGSLGCDCVVINDDVNGIYLYDHRDGIRLQSPAYPINIIDPTGMLPSFSGGFLAGLRNNYDLLEALTYGIVSSSFTCEGSGPFYGVDAMPGLQQNRLKLARELIKRL